MPQRTASVDQGFKGPLTPAATPSSSSESGQIETKAENDEARPLQHRPKGRTGSSQTTKSEDSSSKSGGSKKKSGNAPYKVQRSKLPKGQPASTATDQNAQSGEQLSGVDEAVRKLRESMATGEQTAAETPSQFVFTAPNIQSTEPALEFVSWSHPSHPESYNVRRLIRAHVGRTSHPANARSQAIRKAPRGSAAQAKVPNSRRLTEPDTKKDREQDDHTNAIVRSRSEDVQGYDLDYLRHHLQNCDKTEFFIGSATDAISRLVLNDHSRELGLALNRLGCDISLAMRHFHVIVHAQMPSFESQFGTIGDSRKSRLIPFLLSDPSLTLMIVLVAVTHKLWMTGVNPRCAEIMDLKGFVISALNNAMQDPNRAISDQVLFAVSNLAGYEVLFGSRETYDVHMNGLTRMIRLRGGMSNLGFEGGLERMLHWHDTNFSSIVRGEPYLKGLASTPHLHAAKPDPGAITGGMIKTEPE